MVSVRSNRRRRRGRGRLGPLLALLCILAAGAAVTVGATVFFQVEKIEVAGNSRYTDEEIVAVTGIVQGDNLYRINKVKITGNLLHELPYIEGVNIRRKLPDTILVTVGECGAAACVLPAVPIETAPPAETDPGEEAQPPEDVPAEGEPAAGPWLISAGGKLLEPAPDGTEIMKVAGITALDPAAGAMLRLPEREALQREALLGLLTALETMGQQDRITSVVMYPTHMEFRYLERFWVKMPLDQDFEDKLNLLERVVEETEARHGEDVTGSFDLTRKKYDAIFSAD